MPDENMTLLIDPDSRDLVIDEDGGMAQIYGDETSGQCVRLTLQTWLAEFFLDTAHGTEYGRILGKKPHELEDDEVGEVIRAAALQETEVSHIENVSSEIGNKHIDIALEAALYSGNRISMEVTA